MNKIVLYDQVHQLGEMKEFTNDVINLSEHFFSAVARSVKVFGQHWVAYTQENFQGEFMVYGRGEHGQLGSMDQQIRSLRLVKEDLNNPELILYEHINYDGKVREVIEKESNLNSGGFDELVSSHWVKQGVWILYEDINFNRKKFITFQGDKWPDYRQVAWNDKLSSVRAVTSSDFEL